MLDPAWALQPVDSSLRLAPCDRARSAADPTQGLVLTTVPLSDACRGLRDSSPNERDLSWRHGLTFGREHVDLSAGLRRGSQRPGAAALTLGNRTADDASAYDAFARLRGRDTALPLSYGVDLRKWSAARDDGSDAVRQSISGEAAWKFPGAYLLGGRIEHLREASASAADAAFTASRVGFRGPLGSLGGLKLNADLRGWLGGSWPGESGLAPDGNPGTVGRGLRLGIDNGTGGRSVRLFGGVEEVLGDGAQPAAWRSRMGGGLGYDFPLWGWLGRAGPEITATQLVGEGRDQAGVALRLDLRLTRHDHTLELAQRLRHETDFAAHTTGFGNETMLDYRYTAGRFSFGVSWSRIDEAPDEDGAWRIRALWRIHLDAPTVSGVAP